MTFQRCQPCFILIAQCRSIVTCVETIFALHGLKLILSIHQDMYRFLWRRTLLGQIHLMRPQLLWSRFHHVAWSCLGKKGSGLVPCTIGWKGIGALESVHYAVHFALELHFLVCTKAGYLRFTKCYWSPLTIYPCNLGNLFQHFMCIP